MVWRRQRLQPFFLAMSLSIIFLLIIAQCTIDQQPFASPYLDYDRRRESDVPRDVPYRHHRQLNVESQVEETSDRGNSVKFAGSRKMARNSINIARREKSLRKENIKSKKVWNTNNNGEKPVGRDNIDLRFSKQNNPATGMFGNPSRGRGKHKADYLDNDRDSNNADEESEYSDEDYLEENIENGNNPKRQRKTNTQDENKEFKPGDFDNEPKTFAEIKFSFKEIPQSVLDNIYDAESSRLNESTNYDPSLVHKQPANALRSGDFIQHPTHGIYWSQEVENLVPKGLNDSEINELIASIRKQSILLLEPSTWNKCGRPKNGYVVLENGMSMCARYRNPHNQLILGEVLSYYLSRFIGLDNVPAVTLSVVNDSEHQWRDTDFQALGWDHGKVAALIQWIPHMDSTRSQVKMPELLLDAYETKSIITKSSLLNANITLATLLELIQWGTMIVFDYLTGNYDRVASMQDAADKENKPSIIRENIRNLRKSIKNNKLWLIDNESGLFDAYDTMYKNKRDERFQTFHQQMLQTMCIFQRQVVRTVETLHFMEYPHNHLMTYASHHEPLIDRVTKHPSYTLFVTHFKTRLADVNNWIKKCAKMVS